MQTIIGSILLATAARLLSGCDTLRDCQATPGFGCQDCTSTFNDKPEKNPSGGKDT